MIALILLTETLDISLELSANTNNSGVTLLTRSSVHCADKRTAIRRVNSFEWSKGIGVSGYKAERVSITLCARSPLVIDQIIDIN